jgi:hypothetical protein
MDSLTLLGICALTAMVIFYALEDRGPEWVLAFAAACAFASFYGFLQGTWPLGVPAAIWGGVALRRWRRRTRKTLPSPFVDA